MSSLGILFFSGPYQSQAPQTVIKLANAALDKGYGVQIFCYMDAVNSVLENQKKIEGIFNIEKGFEVQIFCYMDAVNSVLENQKKIEGIFNIEKGFDEIVKKGAIIRLCALCLFVRGTAKSIMKRKDSKGIIKKGGTPDMEKIIKETDRFVVIC
ncbi:MAG: DsrE family protein [Promethearchaeota archaeon]|jgi:sulfur relay (sulfurtransferase) complex TusBCD TusD component (DsrE family)